jgi:hypothetical protein
LPVILVYKAHAIAIFANKGGRFARTNEQFFPLTLAHALPWPWASTKLTRTSQVVQTSSGISGGNKVSLLVENEYVNKLFNGHIFLYAALAVPLWIIGNLSESLNIFHLSLS